MSFINVSGLNSEISVRLLSIQADVRSLVTVVYCYEVIHLSALTLRTELDVIYSTNQNFILSFLNNFFVRRL